MSTATEEKIVPIDSDEAASLKTVTGWVSRDGRFYGDDERAARWGGCTHLPCDDCGELIPRGGYIYCQSCRGTRQAQRYAELPRKEWDGETPLVLYNTDTYFFSEDELGEYCAEHEVAREDLQLMICTPNRPRLVDAFDLLEDVLIEDATEHDIPAPIREAVEVLNRAIEAAEPLSWTEGKYAATFIVAQTSEHGG